MRAEELFLRALLLDSTGSAHFLHWSVKGDRLRRAILGTVGQNTQKIPVPVALQSGSIVIIFLIFLSFSCFRN